MSTSQPQPEQDRPAAGQPWTPPASEGKSKPEVAVGAAFAGGFVVAKILRRLRGR